MPAQTLVCLGLIGTTVADDGTLERAYAEAIATQGVVTGTAAYARSMAQVHRSRGKAIIDVLRELFPENEARAQAAFLAFDRSLGGALQRSDAQAVPGAGEVLGELSSSGVRVCLMSPIPHRHLAFLVTALGWLDRVDLLLSGDDVPRGCPAPDPVLQAMLRLGVDDVRETAVVQATEAGILCGRRSGAGLIAAVLTGKHQAARLREAGATHVLASVADLPAVLADGEAGRVARAVPRPAVSQPS